MRIKPAGRYVTFTAESETERDELLILAGDMAGQQFRVDTIDGDRLVLRLAGPGKNEGKSESKGEGKARAAEAVAPSAAPPEPINITYDDTPMPLRLISNLAETAFELDNRFYASIEGFWQGLKFPDEVDRQRVAELSGHEAKRAGPSAKPGDRFVYDRREIVVGTVDHWELMERACRAKFEQDDDARAALLSTGNHPLVHRVKVDSRTIPGIVMADIWTRLREELRASSLK